MYRCEAFLSSSKKRELPYWKLSPVIPLGFGHKSQCVLVGERKRELPYWKLSSVIPLGFEPKTHSLEGCCSIQLSYGTSILMQFAAAKVRKRLRMWKLFRHFLYFSMRASARSSPSSLALPSACRASAFCFSSPWAMPFTIYGSA